MTEAASPPTAPERAPVTVREGACHHCGLPVPASSPHRAFCCRGCAVVHDILQENGLLRFYDLGGGAGWPVGAPPRPAPPDWLPELVAAGTLAPDCARITLDVQGIRCAACVWALQELWRRRPGAAGIDIDPAIGTVTLTWDPRRLDVADYVLTAASLGYAMAPARKGPRRADRGLLVRMGITAALAMNAMLLAVSGYAGLSAAGGTLAAVFGWVSLGLATAAVATGGPVFLRGALQGLRHRVLHLDLPIALGLVLAWAGSAWSFLLGAGEAYFDSVTVFVALMVAGRYVQQRAVSRNRDQLLRDDGAEHLRTRRIRGDAVEILPVRAVRAGDELVLAPGDLVPTGVEPASPASFSLDWITGESEPRTFAPGERVPAGAFQAGREPVHARAAEDFDSSRLAELLRPPEVRIGLGRNEGFWGRLNRVYVVLVLALAAAGALLWSFLDPSRAPRVAVSILVVTCPCALGLATPLAFHLALAGLRRAGVFVRSPELLEKARHVRKVVFDKTGTLTWGGLRADALRAPRGADRDVLWTMASQSNHPASRAVVEELGDGAFLAGVTVEELPGQGLRAWWKGSEYRLGTQEFVQSGSDGVVPAEEVPLLAFGRDGHVEGCFQLEEDYREGVAGELRSLARSGLQVHLLSGDHTVKVAAAADRLGIPLGRAHGGLKPEEKARLVRALDRDDTLMVGDGLNDGPAFAAAYCAATPALDRPVMPGRADFCFVGATAGAVRDVLATAHRLHGTVVTNLAVAGAYNAAALTACFLGWMSPLLAAVVMPVSSLVLLGTTSARMRPGPPRPGG